MKQKETISVVVPFYNRSRFLERLVNSVMQQTVLPEQLLIIDNGSSIVESKAAWVIIQKSINTEVEIIFISTINIGNANYARNLGMELSRSKYVAFLDSDDWWETTHIEMSFRQIMLSRKAGVYSGAIIHRENKEYNYSADVNEFNSPVDFLFSKNNPIAQTSSYVINKKIISDAGIIWSPSLKRHQDYDFFLSVYYLTSGWCYSRTPTSNIDWCDGGAKKNIDIKSMIRFLKKWEEKFPKKILNRYLLSQVAICHHINANYKYKEYYKKKFIAMNNSNLFNCQLVHFGGVWLTTLIVKIMTAIHLKGLVRKIISIN